jgi:hypothetical protein
MFKLISLLILFCCTSFFSFCQDFEKFNKKELRAFLNHKIIVIDSLANIIDTQHIKLLNQANQNKSLESKVDSLSNSLLNERSQLKKLNLISTTQNVKIDSLVSLIDRYKNEVNYFNISINNLQARVDSFNNAISSNTFKSMLEFYKKTPSLNVNEETDHRDLTYVYPIGWSADSAYFSYFTSFTSGASKFSFRIDQVNQFGLVKNVSLIECEMDCDTENFIASNNQRIKQLIESYGIINIKDVTLKADSTLYKERGLALNIKKTINGTYKDYNLLTNLPKIGNLEISFMKTKQHLSSCYLDLSRYEHSYVQSIGHIESPNKKYLIFFIEHWGGNGFEGYPAVSIELVSFPSN